jgi:hypothetical protein
MISPTLVVDLYVMNIAYTLLLNAWFAIVIANVWKEHLHVKHIDQSGVNMQRIAIDITKLESIECYNDLMRITPGNLIAEGQIHNNMMIQIQIHHHLQIIFVQVDSIVLKLFVHLVVLLLPGQSFQSQNHRQIF